MFAQRADEVFGKVFPFIDISAYAADPGGLFCRLWLRFRLYVALIVTVGHSLRIRDFFGLCYFTDKHAVRTEICLAYHMK